MSLPDIDSIPPGSTVPLDQLSSMFATISTNDGFDLGKLSGLIAAESTSNGGNNNAPTSIVVAASPTNEAPQAVGSSQSLIDDQSGFQSSLQALLGSSVTLNVDATGSPSSGPAPSASATGSSPAPIASVSSPASSQTGTAPGSNGDGFTLPVFPTVTFSDSPSAPANTGGFQLGNIFDGIFGTNSIGIPQSWSELFVKTVDWETLYHGSPGTIDSSGNIIPMPTGSPTGAPVVTGSVVTLVASPIATASDSSSSSGGGILGWIGGLFGGSGSSSSATPVTLSGPVTVVTNTNVVTITSCSNSPCAAPTSSPIPTIINPPNPIGPVTTHTTTGPQQANGAGSLEIVAPLLLAPLLALL